MKKRMMIAAMIVTLNALAPHMASASTSNMTARQQQLMQLLEEKGAKKALASMTDAELLAAKEDLRQIVTALKIDFGTAEQRDGERFGYTLRRTGLVGVGVGGLLLVAGVVADEMSSSKHLSVAAGGGGGTVVGLIFGGTIAAASVAAATTGQLVVWLTPSEAAAVQDRIDLLEKALNILDKRLK